MLQSKMDLVEVWNNLSALILNLFDDNDQSAQRKLKEKDKWKKDN